MFHPYRACCRACFVGHIKTKQTHTHTHTPGPWNRKLCEHIKSQLHISYEGFIYTHFDDVITKYYYYYFSVIYLTDTSKVWRGLYLYKNIPRAGNIKLGCFYNVLPLFQFPNHTITSMATNAEDRPVRRVSSSGEHSELITFAFHYRWCSISQWTQDGWMDWQRERPVRVEGVWFHESREIVLFCSHNFIRRQLSIHVS